MNLFRISAFLVICAVLSACATSPLGRKQLVLMPSSKIDAMGAAGFNEVKGKMKIDSSASTNRYVRCVADPLLIEAGEDPQEWEIAVFQEKSANAFALPGKKIGVHTGILSVAKNQDQLAAVLGHEIGHVQAQHGNERVSEAFVVQGGITAAAVALGQKQGPRFQLLMAALGLGLQFGLILPHGRTQESEADIIGLDLMSRAGFNPRESVKLWENMESSSGGQPPEFMSTHPSHGTRIQNLGAHMEEALVSFGDAKTRGKKPRCLF